MNALSMLKLRPGREIPPVKAEAAAPVALPPSLCPGTILVPCDFSGVAAALLHRLMPLAERSGAALHILHVIEPAGTPALGAADVEETILESEMRASAARLQLQEWVERTLPRRVAITSTVRVGQAAEEIISQAEALDADLIVMSAHVGKGLRGVLLRTTTERVAREAPCPVLVIAKDKVHEFMQNVKEFPPRSWKRILLPVDLTDAVRGGLAYGAAIAMETGAKLHLLHAVPGNGSPPGEAQEAAKQRLAEWAGAELCWPVEFEGTVWTGIPLQHAILMEARQSKVDAILLPARDRSWTQRHRLWSVTDGILRHAPCPVLSVRGGLGGLAG
ncbi:MAG TPA: universal stress protein [Verrucomicrobiota bacterium]|jgi:nucleotide-binding universal stress UspA family protein|nr:universal stress protein [Verrucomicrobiota bacterium]